MCTCVITVLPEINTLIFKILVLDSVPDLDMVVHLPEILDGIFTIFQDKSPEIRKM